MRKCPNCGVRNDGDSLFCMACGSSLVTAAPKRESKNKCPNCGVDLEKGELFCPECGTKRSRPSAKPKRRKVWWRVLLCIIAVLLVAMSAYLFFAWRAWNQTLDAIENRDFETAQDYYQKCKILAGFIDDFDVVADYIEAWILFEDEEYQVAAELFAAMVEKHEGGLEAEQMAIEAKYYYAVQLTEDALYDSAIDILWDLYQDHAYQPAYELWIENTYLWSLQRIEECDYKVAYDALNQISEEDERAEQELEELKPIIYEVGVAAYIAGEYEEARELLLCIGSDENYNASQYITLIHSHIYNIYSPMIVGMIGFEDANTIVEKNGDLMVQYLLGLWEGAGYHMSMNPTANGSGSHIFTCDFPSYPDGEHFYIVDGIYKVGDSEASAKNYLSFTIIDKDTVNVYCYPNGTTYTMYHYAGPELIES